MKKCKHCQSEIEDIAKVCPICRNDQGLGVFKITIGVISGVILGLLVLICIFLYIKDLEPANKTVVTASNNNRIITPTPTSAPVPTITSAPVSVSDSIIEIRAKDLTKAFNENILKAAKEYNGKTVKIVGKVDRVGVSLSYTYVMLKTKKTNSEQISIQCFFNNANKDDIDKIADLSKGDNVTVTGQISVQSTNITVNDCKFK